MSAKAEAACFLSTCCSPQRVMRSRRRDGQKGAEGTAELERKLCSVVVSLSAAWALSSLLVMVVREQEKQAQSCAANKAIFNATLSRG